MPYLLVDFEQRCAYSMRHIDRDYFEIDHFDPRKKNEVIQEYENLFPATRHVNRAKWDSWPTKKEEREGSRFLNPCVEVDYGVHIFEDPNTHEVFGVTKPGIWHVAVCGLNAPHLVRERQKRALHIERLRKASVRIKSADLEDVLEVIDSLKLEVASMIPEIPYKNPGEL